MGRCTGGCERASEHLWPLSDVHRGRTWMYRVPLLHRRVSCHLSRLISHLSPQERSLGRWWWFIRLIVACAGSRLCYSHWCVGSSSSWPCQRRTSYACRRLLVVL